MKFESQYFLHRLKSLQSLCSSSSDQQDQLPNSLLFVPGTDGRHNKGSLSLLKYLFQGSVGKDIYEGYLDDKYECLEEIVLLIQASSVSIFWSREAKSLIGPLLSHYPFVIEYCPTKEEEENVDKFQLRKCEDTKKMILESVQKAGVIGVPIPLGYDDVLETENWPLLQAFALDTVVTPTGFFTARYAVVDITESLNIIFQTLDGFYIEKAIQVLQENILPHNDQMLSLLFSSVSNSQRDSFSADEMVAPLDLLFDFGELEARFPADPALRPRLYVGEAIRRCFGILNTSYKWKDEIFGENPICIIESSEPSTGLRWSRTYFLQRGKAFQDIKDEEALVDARSSNAESVSLNGDLIDRMEDLYFKLGTCLRWAVQNAFANYNDILEAGGFIQNYITDLMAGKLSIDSSSDLDAINKITLKDSERLLVHMDCMNAFGQIVKIEDVDDMGGQCWTYIRVSVHDIAGNSNNVVAIGDTFLFSPNYSSSLNKMPHKALRLQPNIQDQFCITHAIPAYRCTLGFGLEEIRARNLLAATKSIHTLSTLNMGTAVELSGVGLASAVMVTNNPMYPFFQADLRLFTGGLVVERIDKSPLALILSIKSHVEVMWSVDLGEAYTNALRLIGIDAPSTSSELLDGIFIIFKLRTSFDDVDESSLSGYEKCIQYDLWNKIFPSLLPTTYLGLMIPANSRASAAFTSTHFAWKNFARMYDIPDIRGLRDDIHRIPEGLLESYLTALNHQSLTIMNSSEDDDADLLGGSLLQGYLMPRKSFAICENVRLESSTETDHDGSESKEATINIPKGQAIVVIGASGSGVLNIYSQLLERFESGQNMPHCHSCILDLTSFSQKKVHNILSSINSSPRDVTLIGIISSPVDHVNSNEILKMLSVYVCDIALCISVVQPLTTVATTPSSNHIGIETWIAACKEVLNVGPLPKKSIVVLIESDQRGASDHVFSDLQLHIDSVNPKSTLVRMQPNNLWLNAEVLDLIMSSVEWKPIKAAANTHTYFYSERLSQPYPGICSLQTLQIDPPGVASWDIERLQILLRRCFPRALLSNTIQASDSFLPKVDHLKGIQLALFLAKVKVFAIRKRQQGLATFQTLLQQFNPRDISSVGSGILSVHGIFKLSDKSTAPKFVCIEANSSTIIIRPCSHNDKFPANVIHIVGSFSTQDIETVQSLFAICTPFILTIRKAVTPSDISPSSYPAIEEKYSEIPLPSGWWFDGTGYVDVHGTRLAYRPDIDQLVHEYVNEKNSDILEYNRLIESVLNYLS